MLKNVKVAQIKKFKKQSPFIFEFCFWEDPPHPQKCICIFRISMHLFSALLLHYGGGYAQGCGGYAQNCGGYAQNYGGER